MRKTYVLQDVSIVPGSSLAQVFDAARTVDGVFEAQVFVPIRKRAGQIERWVKKGWVVATMFEATDGETTCNTCGGHGMVVMLPDRNADPYLLGSVVSGSRECEKCHGTGKSTPPTFYALTEKGAEVANDAAMVATLEDIGA